MCLNCGLAHVQAEMPPVSSERLLEKLYPYRAMLGKEGVSAVQDTLKVSSLLGL